MLIMATSNVTEAIDLAFVDRADIKQYIGPPPVAGIFKILTSCIVELNRVSNFSYCEVHVYFNYSPPCLNFLFPSRLIS